MRHMIIAFIACITSLSFASERITFFESDITIRADGSILVTETIAVNSTGTTIKRGIVREFPTKYRDYLGTSYFVDFRLNRVLLDDEPVHHKEIKESNGVKVYIGSEHIYLRPGHYTYTIEYETQRQIGFFKQHDELYWNVTGNGWRLPIDYAKAIVHLPKDVPIKSIEAATGYFGQQGKNYTASINDKNEAIFSTTRPLRPEEGLTIAVTWPKGWVAEPTLLQKLWWFFRDNWVIALVLLALLLILLFMEYCYRVREKINAPGVVIPHYYPPENMLPSAVGYLNDKTFEEKFVAADIVNLAIHGFIEIEAEKSSWGRYTYTLKKTKKAKSDDALTAHEKEIVFGLFAKGSSIKIEQKNQLTLAWLSTKTKLFCNDILYRDLTSFKADFKGHDIAYVGCGIALFAAAPVVFSMLLGGAPGYYMFLLIILGILAFLSVQWGDVYTPRGRRTQDHIDGFKLFLKAAEIDRMKIVGTPPIKTPELYEKYLPYAMVLGLEDEWTGQFAPLFEQKRAEGHPYQPRWYVGRSFSRGFSNGFASSLTSSLSSAISASSTPPGRSSGSGGGSRSGGGGGGGGGGGW